MPLGQLSGTFIRSERTTFTVSVTQNWGCTSDYAILRALSQGLQVVHNPPVTGPLLAASSVHARIAAYQQILATALHTVLETAVSLLAQVRPHLGPKAEPFIDNMSQSLAIVQPLSAAIADASRDQMRLASRGIARAIRQCRKAVIPKAKSEFSFKFSPCPSV